MIIKCVRGDYFPGLIDYIMRWGQYAASAEIPTVLEHPGIFHPKTAAAQLWQQASLAPDRTRRAVHLIARAEKGLTEAQYRDLAHRMLRATGLEGRPYLLILHDDDGHLHLATVEVDENGAPPPRRQVSRSLKREVSPEEAKALPRRDIVSRSWDSHLAWRLTKVSRQVEIDFGLRQLGRERDTYEQIRVPTWQLKKESEEGLIPLAKGLAKEIKAALDLPTWDERNEALAEQGLALRPYAGPNKKRQGLQVYALSDPSHFCNASDLGKACGLGTLEKRSEEPFRDWYARHEPETVPAPQISAIPGRLQSDNHLVRLKGEYDDLIKLQRQQRAERKFMRQRHKADRQRDRSIVRALRDRLAATRKVSKTWIRTLCRIVRAGLQAKTRSRHLVEIAQASALPGRQLKWPEFLASRASADPEACRVHGQVRNNLSVDDRLRELSEAKLADQEQERTRRQAQEAAIQEQARADAVVAAAQAEAEKEAAYWRRRRIRELGDAIGNCLLRVTSVDDHGSILQFLEKRGDQKTRAAFLHPDHHDGVNAMMTGAVDEQHYHLRRLLRYVEAQELVSFVDRKSGWIDWNQIADVELKAVAIHTRDWPEVKKAARIRLTQLRAREEQVAAPGTAAPSQMSDERPADTVVAVAEKAVIPSAISLSAAHPTAVTNESAAPTDTAVPAAAPVITRQSADTLPSPAAEVRQKELRSAPVDLLPSAPVASEVEQQLRDDAEPIAGAAKPDQDKMVLQVDEERNVSAPSSSQHGTTTEGRSPDFMASALNALQRPKPASARMGDLRDAAKRRRAQTANADGEGQSRLIAARAEETKQQKVSQNDERSQNADAVNPGPSVRLDSVEKQSSKRVRKSLDEEAMLEPTGDRPEGISSEQEFERLHQLYEAHKAGLGR
ncbi:relaxase/mobilization nuclease domain-containing protein [Altericroceibacterium xinjiangense]|uniref:relaxase/mobilization nuclease domain-containing protein n=1 Tax=Altericroceibacterium xinjiangense TaxID=762261 RepID=UPI000F7D6579|nr:hypothetical protein [Altericroceibacterium xinjiangense]